MRFAAISAQVLLILFAAFYLKILLPFFWLAVLVGLEIVFQVYSIHRVIRGALISTNEVLVQILFDSIVLAALVYFSGGPHNPFIYLLLLSIALATWMLRPRDLVIVAAMQLLLYSLLNLYQRPLALGDNSPLASFHVHLMGMWINFTLTVVLIAFFGFLARQSMLQKEKQIQTLREKQLKDEQILSLGIMSASAAHELGTPLSTMAIVVDDLVHEKLPQSINEDMQLLAKQINNCRNIINSLSDKSQHIRNQLMRLPLQSTPSSTSLKKQIQDLLENWLVYRPQIQLEQTWPQTQLLPEHNLPISVEQAVTNLLDNAADASLANGQQQMALNVAVDERQLIIEIKDLGEGITEDTRQLASTSIQETKKTDGLGWGLFLSNVSIERVGGQVQLLPNQPSGTITRIEIPVEGKV